jgi:hypothetical protein
MTKRELLFIHKNAKHRFEEGFDHALFECAQVPRHKYLRRRKTVKKHISSFGRIDIGLG